MKEFDDSVASLIYRRKMTILIIATLLMATFFWLVGLLTSVKEKCIN